MRPNHAGGEDERFAFGANWQRFLRLVDERRIAAAAASLREMLGPDDLRGLRFLDVGCGSGLFGLAALRLGAEVGSFDYDPQSVACAVELRRRFAHDDPRWVVEAGSALDAEYLRGLGRYDVVYAWGVLHHTGDMRQAMENVLLPLAAGGRLAVSLYNDQGWRSRYWKRVKRAYQRGKLARAAIVGLHAPLLLAPRFAARLATGRLKLERGMSLWHDAIDWLGGYPFEVARPTEVVEFYTQRGLRLERETLCGRRLGCNEFVFRRPPDGG
jgi:2-polyprenyl-6-hydroxyphenyl methylase/3-demethylubiquinone-9 3-methyltransferase